jgi:stage II sporulation protein AA (anti-sigma F factor antagonist)
VQWKSEPGDKMPYTEILKFSQRAGFLWVEFLQELTLDNYHAIEVKIMSQLTGRADRVALDFAAVHSLYSSGLGCIVRLQKSVTACGGVLCVVNASKAIKLMFEINNLDKVVPIYATDVEWELFRDEVWSLRIARRTLEFFFITQIESPVCFITLAGSMDSLHDLSRVSEFDPDPSIRYFVMNLDSLELIDTYGSQLFLEMVSAIRARGGICVSYGASNMVGELLSLMSIGVLLEHCETEIEANQRIERYLRAGK